MSNEFETEGRVLRKYNGLEAHVVIPDGVTIIGKGAFKNCTSLAEMKTK